MSLCSPCRHCHLNVRHDDVSWIPEAEIRPEFNQFESPNQLIIGFGDYACRPFSRRS